MKMRTRHFNKRKKDQVKLDYLRLEMYSYHDTKKALHGQLSCINSPHILHMCDVVSKINLALELLEKKQFGKEMRDVIEDMYFRNVSLTYDGLALKYYVHPNTIRYWEKEFFSILGDLLGIYNKSEYDIILLTQGGE
jgi:predicted nucleic acid-binding OB-fold protein